MMRNYINCIRAGMVVLLIVAGSQVIAGSTHYRWINERGEPVYSDRPPPKGVEYEVVSTQSRFKRTVSAEEGAVPLETSPRVGNEFFQIDPDAASRNQKNPVYCEQARQNLEALTTSLQVNVRNDDGEVRPLTAEQMEVERNRARGQIEKYCE
jgi:hypothetical protein